MQQWFRITLSMFSLIINYHRRITIPELHQSAQVIYFSKHEDACDLQYTFTTSKKQPHTFLRFDNNSDTNRILIFGLLPNIHADLQRKDYQIYKIVFNEIKRVSGQLVPENLNFCANYPLGITFPTQFILEAGHFLRQLYSEKFSSCANCTRCNFDFVSSLLAVQTILCAIGNRAVCTPAQMISAPTVIA